MKNCSAAIAAKCCFVLTALVCIATIGFAQSPQSESENRGRIKNVHFVNANQKSVIKTLASQLGIDARFDDSVKGSKVNIDLNDLTMEAALRIVLIQQRLEARLLEEKTIIVFSDDEVSREKYKEDKPWPAKKGE